MKKILIGFVLVVFTGLILFFLFRNKGNEAQFRTAKTTGGDIKETVSATGTVNAVTTVLVGTQVSGRIKQIFVDFNSPVKKGQIIAQIDPDLFDAQVAQSKANLLSARANKEKAVAALTDAKRTLNRNSELFSKNLISKSELDTAETNYETANAQITVAESQIAQSDAALKLAETNLTYTSIISPVDGIIVSRNVDVGQTVAASFQTPTLFTIARDLTKMQIDTNVDEADIGKIKVEQNVEFTVDTYPDTTFRGKVLQVRNAPITVQNVVTYDVVIKVDNPDLKLRPGMTANVAVITAIKKGILKIPNSALRFKPEVKMTEVPKERGTGVWIIEKGKPKHIRITIGISDGSYTELISGEIKENEELIVESLSKNKQQSTQGGPRFF